MILIVMTPKKIIVAIVIVIGVGITRSNPTNTRRIIEIKTIIVLTILDDRMINLFGILLVIQFPQLSMNFPSSNENFLTDLVRFHSLSL